MPPLFSPAVRCCRRGERGRQKREREKGRKGEGRKGRRGGALTSGLYPSRRVSRPADWTCSSSCCASCGPHFLRQLTLRSADVPASRPSTLGMADESDSPPESGPVSELLKLATGLDGRGEKVPWLQWPWCAHSPAHVQHAAAQKRRRLGRRRGRPSRRGGGKAAGAGLGYVLDGLVVYEDLGVRHRGELGGCCCGRRARAAGVGGQLRRVALAQTAGVRGSMGDCGPGWRGLGGRGLPAMSLTAGRKKEGNGKQDGALADQSADQSADPCGGSFLPISL